MFPPFLSVLASWKPEDLRSLQNLECFHFIVIDWCTMIKNSTFLSKCAGDEAVTIARHFGARYQNDTQVRCYSNSYIVHCEEGSHIHSLMNLLSANLNMIFKTKMKNLQLLKISKKWKWPETVERMRIHSNALIHGEVMILLLSIYLRFLEVNIPAH